MRVHCCTHHPGVSSYHSLWGHLALTVLAAAGPHPLKVELEAGGHPWLCGGHCPRKAQRGDLRPLQPQPVVGLVGHTESSLHRARLDPLALPFLSNG